MKNINEGSRGAARLARLQAAAQKAAKTGNDAKERKINATAAMRGGRTAVQTRMAIRGGADPKTAKATMPKPGAKRAFEKRSAAIANFAATGEARKAIAKSMKKIKPKRPMVAAEGVEMGEGYSDYDKMMPSALRHGVKTHDKTKGTKSGVKPLVGLQKPKKTPKYPKTTPRSDATMEYYSVMNGDEQLDEGVKRKLRLLRAKMKVKNYTDDAKLKSLETSYNSELSRRVARKLRKGGAPKRTVVRFFNKDGSTTAADKAISKFNSAETRKVEKLRASGIKPQYDHVEHDEDTIEEGSIGAARMKRILRAGRKKPIPDMVDRMSKLTKKRIVRAGGAEDLKVRSTSPAAQVRSLNALHRFHDKARARKSGVKESVQEGFQAKRMRVIRKEILKSQPSTGKIADYLKTSFKKKLARNAAINAKYPERAARYGGGQQGNMLLRAALRKKAMDKKRGLGEETFFEALQAKLNRAKGKAYKLGMAGKTNAHAKAMRRAADLEDKVAAMQARRGGANPEAVARAGNITGKRGVPTKKGMKLAGERRRGQTLFRARARDAEQRGRNATPSQKAEKRKFQKGMAAFRNAARSGDFGQDNAAGLRVRYNYEKAYGRLKDK
jgi:hypothetical protein